jgi:hypothetical protein
MQIKSVIHRVVAAFFLKKTGKREKEEIEKQRERENGKNG